MVAKSRLGSRLRAGTIALGMRMLPYNGSKKSTGESTQRRYNTTWDAYVTYRAQNGHGHVKYGLGHAKSDVFTRKYMKYTPIQHSDTRSGHGVGLARWQFCCDQH